MLRLLQMAFLAVYISKIFRGGMPPDHPSRSHAFGARLHDHSHDAGFATVQNTVCTPLYIVPEQCSKCFRTVNGAACRGGTPGIFAREIARLKCDKFILNRHRRPRLDLPAPACAFLITREG